MLSLPRLFAKFTTNLTTIIIWEWSHIICRWCWTQLHLFSKMSIPKHHVKCKPSSSGIQLLTSNTIPMSCHDVVLYSWRISPLFACILPNHYHTTPGKWHIQSFVDDPCPAVWVSAKANWFLNANTMTDGSMVLVRTNGDACLSKCGEDVMAACRCRWR